MNKPPAFQWYPKDAQTDENVAAMDDREFGFYFRCLSHAWLNEGLPADLDRLARVMGRTREYLDQVWPAVSPCWVPDLDRPGRLVNPRQEKQREEYSLTREAKKAGANARWGKKTPVADAGAMHMHSVSNASRVNKQCSAISNLHTAHSSEALHPDGIPVDEFFEQIFRTHPNKTQRGLAENYFSQVTGIERLAVQQDFERGHSRWLASELWRWKNGARVPTLAQWILDRGWQYAPPAESNSDPLDEAVDAAMKGRKEAA